jgi:oligopeptide/dipeptide ABC transporter ATP-binding protein
MNSVLLDIRNLSKHFPVGGRFVSGKRGMVKAVNGLSLSLYKGETLGLVGESGCGKTTVGRLVVRLEEPTDGTIFFQGKDIVTLPKGELKELRKKIQLIFQDPYLSLNPRKNAGAIVGEPLLIHRIAHGADLRARTARLMEIVGLTEEHMGRYPHEFSGGQRQRIGVARALALNPDLIVADEPVSALDVSIQAQILNLLKDLQRDFELTYLFISHDLSVIGYMSDRIAVMYLGKIVELADRDSLFGNPLHPYTELLLSAVPLPDPSKKKRRRLLEWEIPSSLTPPAGCAFHPRCPCRMERCETEEPAFVIAGNGHGAACHLRRH